jgi:hypothetical protein
MHRLRLLYAPCFVPSAVLASSAQSTANFGFAYSVKMIVSSGGAVAWLPALSGSRTTPVLARGHNSVLGTGVLRARIDPNRFGKSKLEWMADDSLIGSGISSPPAPPSPIL